MNKDVTVDQIADKLVAWVKERDTYSIYNYWCNLDTYPEVFPEELGINIKVACKKAVEKLFFERKNSSGSYVKRKIYFGSPELRPTVLLGMLHDDLSEKGLKNSTIESHFYNIEFFFDPYLKKCTILHPLEVSAADIEYYVGNWYLRKVLDATLAQVMGVLTSLRKFYNLLWAHNYLGDELYQGIKEECNNRKKYQNRYESYHAIDNADDWMDWVF